MYEFNEIEYKNMYNCNFAFLKDQLSFNFNEGLKSKLCFLN